jgi:hypothetical protein
MKKPTKMMPPKPGKTRMRMGAPVAKAMNGGMMGKQMGKPMGMPANSNKGGAMRGLQRAAAMSGRTMPMVPTARAKKGGFLGGMAEGMGAGFTAGESARERREKREQQRMSKEGIYRRGGKVK